MKSRFSDFIIEQILIFFSSIFLDFSLLCIINDFSSQGIQFVFPYVFGLTIVSGIINLIIFRIFTLEKASVWAFIRYLIISLVLYTGIGIVFSKVFDLHLLPFFTFISVLITFIHMEYLNKPVACHTRFIFQCENRTGTDLAQELYHNNVDALDFAQSANGCKVTSVIFIFILCFIVIGIEQSKLKVSLITYLFISLHILFTFILLLFFNIYDKESFYAFLGFDRVFSFRNKILKVSLIISLIAGLTGFIISSNNAILKIKHLPLKFNTEAQSVNNVIIPQEQNEVEFTDFGSFGELNDKPFISEKVWIVLKYIFIVAIIAGFLIFMIKPFISDKWKDFFAEGKLFKLFRNFSLNLKHFISNLFSGNKLKNNYSKIETKSFTDSINEFLKSAKKSKEKKAELDRLSKVFVKVIEWGNENGFIYTKNLAPLEYTKLMNIESAEKAGILFEKALYAKELLTGEEEKLFKQYVNEVIS